MTAPGTIWQRTDHELVGRILAAKLRLREQQRGVGDTVRVEREGRRG